MRHRTPKPRPAGLAGRPPAPRRPTLTSTAALDVVVALVVGTRLAALEVPFKEEVGAAEKSWGCSSSLSPADGNFGRSVSGCVVRSSSSAGR